MKNKMIRAAVGSLAATVLLLAGYAATSRDLLLSLAITFGTVSYHLVMRLLVSLAFNRILHNRADLHRRWYRPRRWEAALYRILRVKKWKNRLPTEDPSLFNPKIHSWSEIAQAMCQAELIHETIVLLSFLPIGAGRWFGAYPVFIVTSLLSAAFDGSFAIIQRFNRPRVLRLAEKCSVSGQHDTVERINS